MSSKRFVDLSLAIAQDLLSNPSDMIPRIDYKSHIDGVERMMQKKNLKEQAARSNHLILFLFKPALIRHVGPRNIFYKAPTWTGKVPFFHPRGERVVGIDAWSWDTGNIATLINTDIHIDRHHRHGFYRACNGAQTACNTFFR